MQGSNSKVQTILDKCDALLKDNKVDAALMIIKDFLSNHPKAALVWNMQGIIYCDYLFEYKEAIFAFEKAKELNKKNDFIYLNNLGNCYKNLEQPKEAIEAYEAALLKNKDYASPYIPLAYLYVSQKNLEKAKEYFQKAFQLVNKRLESSETSELFNKRGMIYCDFFKQYDQAIEDFLTAIRLEKSSIHQYEFNIGNCYLGKTDYKNAIKYYTQAIENSNKVNKSYYHNRAFAYYRQRNVQAAINDLQTILTKYPKDEEILLYLSDLYEELKDYDNALLMLNRALDINPTNSNALNSRGSLLVDKIGSYEEAIKDFTKAIELNEEYSYIYYFNIGNAFSKLGDYNSAIHNYLASLTLNPSYDAPLLNLGLSYFYLAEYEEAIDYFNKDLITRPNNFDTLEFRARAYLALGKANRAWADINRMKQINSQAPSLFLILAEYYFQVDSGQEFFRNIELALEKKANIYEIASIEGIFKKYKDNQSFKELLKKYNIKII